MEYTALEYFIYKFWDVKFRNFNFADFRELIVKDIMDN